MHIEYRWHCVQCESVVWTKTCKTPSCDGCLKCYGEQHSWEGEEREVRDEDD